MNSSLIIILFSLLLVGCELERKANNSSSAKITLIKPETNYLAYKISNEDWIEVINDKEILITNEDTLILATICTASGIESYSSHAVIHNADSINAGNLENHHTNCDRFNSINNIISTFTVRSQQDEIGIISVSLPNKTMTNGQPTQSFNLEIPSEESYNIAVIGVSQENQFYIYKSQNLLVKESDELIIDFYGDNSFKVTEFQPTPILNWDHSSIYYDIDDLWINLSSSSFIDNDPSIPKKSISVPDELLKTSGSYISSFSEDTKINDYYLRSNIPSKSIPKEPILPDDLTDLHNINVNYNPDEGSYILSITDNIDSVIPIPLQSLTIEHTSYQEYDSNHPIYSHWKKAQSTTSYLKENGSITLIPVDFHLLPNSPITEQTSAEKETIDSEISFSGEFDEYNNRAFYSLSRRHKIIYY